MVDCGCGKSYRAFVLYYYWTELRDIEAEIIGLDLKAEVGEGCNVAAGK